MGVADSKHFLHLVRAIVAAPDAGSQAWAEAAGAPRATAYRLLRPFRFHGAIDAASADPRRVVALAADLRKDRAVPFTTVFRQSVLDRITQEPSAVQLAYQSAANRYGFFEESTTTLRVDAERLRGVPAGVTASGSVRADADGRTQATPRRPLAVLYQDDLARFPEPTLMGGTAVTDAVITYVDLLSHPRAGAHAEFMDGVLVRAGLLPERP